MRAFVLLAACVLGSIGVGVGTVAAVGDGGSTQLGFSCKPPALASDTTVHLSSGKSVWVLDAPTDATIASPPFSTIDHLAVFEAICFGPDVPSSIAGGDPTQVRVAWQDTKTHVWKIGPVVMAFMGLSDTRLATAFTPGYVWLYDPRTTTGSTAVQISATTGRVVQTLRLPYIDRPTAYMSKRGLWIYNSDQGVDTSNYVIYHVSNDLKVTKLVHQTIDPLPR